MPDTDAHEEIQKRLGYDFSDISLLSLALTHSSYTNEAGITHAGSNERLEFLGDAVTGLGVAAMIFERFPELAEGKMSALRANLVKSDSLADIARSLGLAMSLRLGFGADKTGIRENDSVLEDAFEAVIGYLYLKGSFDRIDELMKEVFYEYL